jgi:hypothetical protein
MTSNPASVVLVLVFLSDAKNMSTQMLAFMPAAEIALESVELAGVFPTLYDQATSKINVDMLDNMIGIVVFTSNLAFGNACTGSVAARNG